MKGCGTNDFLVSERETLIGPMGHYKCNFSRVKTRDWNFGWGRHANYIPMVGVKTKTK